MRAELQPAERTREQWRAPLSRTWLEAPGERLLVGVISAVRESSGYEWRRKGRRLARRRRSRQRRAGRAWRARENGECTRRWTHERPPRCFCREGGGANRNERQFRTRARLVRESVSLSFGSVIFIRSCLLVCHSVLLACNCFRDYCVGINWRTAVCWAWRIPTSGTLFFYVANHLNLFTSQFSATLSSSWVCGTVACCSRKIFCFLLPSCLSTHHHSPVDHLAGRAPTGCLTRRRLPTSPPTTTLSHPRTTGALPEPHPAPSSR